MSEGTSPEEPQEVNPEGEEHPDEDSLGFGQDLELNQFDGLPFSSRYYKLLKQRKGLSVWKVRGEFEEALVHNQLVLVSGTAKTGRSTQVPQWCAEFCLSAQYQHGMVVCTQTHRQQAVDLALRVADEMDVNIGHEVGYTIPLETCCSSDTVLRYCTDDMLLREMMSDPFLEHYGVIVIDQAHERTVSTDLLLGLLKDVLLQRPKLRVVVLAAPPFTDKLLGHFGDVPLIRLEASCPVEVVHSNSGSKDHFYSALRLVLEIHRTKEDGDMIVFLASAEEVDCARSILQREGTRLGAELGPMVPVVLNPPQRGLLPILIEEPDARMSRRVFLSAPQGEDMWWPAESVNFIIDTGVQKKMVYNPRIRANSETLQPISRCQADVRRQLSAPTGKCFCLYPEEPRLPAETSSQILESNITPTVLFLKRMEIAGLGQCDFIDRPDPEGLMQALEELDYLAALDDDGNLSEIGIIISEFPLDPQMAKALLASCEFDCVSEMLTIAAMLSAPSCFLEPSAGLTHEAVHCHRKFQHPEGDHFTLISIYNTFKQNQREQGMCVEKWCKDYFLDHGALKRADAIRSELTDILNRIELPISQPSFGTKTNAHNIKRALLAGFFMQIARDVDGSGNYFILTHKHMAQVHPLSGYGAQSQKLGLPEWVIFHEYTLSDNNYMRTVSEISPQVFIQMAPLYFFYNLPSSESKDILQDILDPDGSRNCKDGKQRPLTSNSDCTTESQTYDRCVIQ
ncbi:putative pre-mRNA-splicing factor ATP-dependent RNA helicase DHX32 [Sphaeramia orbicularis]|uniref:Putative pre-mRNA-splicing factor ATP-dependent RNA helicase DHX32 n=1 Tax=Sphaeramia orbicularis TaxID=375764 RepID=A0A673CKY3_9TELE|nr:putative pre-mRNA-splicing factor ATP-dependent RNA helicase DHX32 [Sphaeramia orbicularis]XP_029978329.1 putative pre-mRNA-splicing factor ATP-dependent RNA helicase DHX32 [Sphaeramia orbicularis]XP_029978330.1 putative pre-mRNA-splicing factor ATP-dependent RNA helicase DHX32 [Sphaeramia orbicularis]